MAVHLELKLNIFETYSKILSNDQEFINRLQKDFKSFVVSDLKKVDFTFDARLGNIPYDRLPDLKSSSQSFNSITYDDGEIRYNDYYKEALTIYDYKNEKCELFSEKLDRLHEITYLVILSRTGKLMDTNGFYKVHACGVKKNNVSVVTMLPMKGGKTTLFTNLIKDKSVEIISDDTPIVDRNGNIHSYPLRIGLENLDQFPEEIKTKAYTIDRKQYGKKFLISTEDLGNSVAAQSTGRIVLINGIRCSNRDCELVKISTIRMFTFLCTHMIVGLGLPMIIEYFLRPSISDWILNLKIGFGRTFAALRLAMKAENYLCYMGENPELNAEMIQSRFLK